MGMLSNKEHEYLNDKQPFIKRDLYYATQSFTQDIHH